MLGRLSQCGPLRTAQDSKVGPTVLAKPASHPNGPPLTMHTLPPTRAPGVLLYHPPHPGWWGAAPHNCSCCLLPCGGPVDTQITRPRPGPLFVRGTPLRPTSFTCSGAHSLCLKRARSLPQPVTALLIISEVGKCHLLQEVSFDFPRSSNMGAPFQTL